MTGELGRRRLLAHAAGIGVAAALPFPSRAASRYDMRLRLHNLHTGEWTDTVFWDGAQARLVPEGLAAIDRLLRDHRTGEVKAMDPRLIVLLYRLRLTLDTVAPFHIISGYRSRATNDALLAAGHDVAANSLHVFGRAIDVRLPDRRLEDLKEAALAFGWGGVGFYPGEFVHLDTGPVRRWG